MADNNNNKLAKFFAKAFHEVVMPHLEEIKGDVEEIKGDINEVKTRIDKVETDITFIKRDIRDIKVELSDTPSRREFNELKARVDKHHPVSA